MTLSLLMDIARCSDDSYEIVWSQHGEIIAQHTCQPFILPQSWYTHTGASQTNYETPGLIDAGNPAKLFVRQGQALYEHFFAKEPVAQTFERLLRASSASDIVLQVRSNDEQVHVLPWELLRVPEDEERWCFAVLEFGLQVVRCASQPEMTPVVQDVSVRGASLRVVGVVGAPRGQAAKEASVDWENEQDILLRGYRDLPVEDVRLPDDGALMTMMRVVRQVQPQLLHCVGKISQRSDGTNGLLMENDEGARAWLTCDVLEQLQKEWGGASNTPSLMILDDPRGTRMRSSMAHQHHEFRAWRRSEHVDASKGHECEPNAAEKAEGDGFVRFCMAVSESYIPLVVVMREPMPATTMRLFVSSFSRHLHLGTGLALFHARRALAKSFPGMGCWSLPVCFASTPALLSQSLFAPNASEVVIDKPEPSFTGTSCFRPNFHVGRRQVWHEVMKRVQPSGAAPSRSLLVLYGTGGCGKSLMIGQIARYLTRQGYRQLTISQHLRCGESLIRHLSFGLQQWPEFSALQERLMSQRFSSQEKLSLLLRVFCQHRFLLVLDPLRSHTPSSLQPAEQHLMSGDDVLSQIVQGIHEKQGRSLLLITATLPLSWSTSLYHPRWGVQFALQTLSPRESEKWIRRLPRLGPMARSQPQQIERLLSEVGGYPQLLMWCDALVFLYEEIPTQLWETLASLRERGETTVERASALEELCLSLLFERLEEGIREFLTRVCVFEVPVPREALLMQADAVLPWSGEQAREKALYTLSLLVELGLLHRIPPGHDRPALFYTHEKVAVWLEKKAMSAVWRAAHRAAGMYFKRLMSEQNQLDIGVALLARLHYLRCHDDWTAAELALTIEESLSTWGFCEEALLLMNDTLARLDGLPEHIHMALKARTQHNLGVLHQLRGEHNAAMEHYNESLQGFESLDDAEAISISLHNIGMIHASSGEWNAAMEHYQASLVMARESGVHEGMATTLHHIGKIHERLEAWDAASAEHKAALMMATDTKDQTSMSVAHQRLAAMAEERGEWEMALEHYRQAAQLLEQFGQESEAAWCFYQVARLLTELEEFEDAIQQVRLGIALFKQVHDRGGVGTCLRLLAQLYEEGGESNRAIETYKSALHIWESLGEETKMVTELHQLGVLFQKQGFWRQSLSYFHQCMLVFLTLDDASSAAWHLHLCGQIFLKQNEYEQALARFLPACAIFLNSGSPNLHIAQQSAMRALDKLQDTADVRVIRRAVCWASSQIPDTYLSAMPSLLMGLGISSLEPEPQVESEQIS